MTALSVCGQTPAGKGVATARDHFVTEAGEGASAGVATARVHSRPLPLARTSQDDSDAAPPQRRRGPGKSVLPCRRVPHESQPVVGETGREHGSRRSL